MDNYNLTQASGMRSRVSFALEANQQRGAMTIFVCDGLSHAPHQLNELFATM